MSGNIQKDKNHILDAVYKISMVRRKPCDGSSDLNERTQTRESRKSRMKNGSEFKQAEWEKSFENDKGETIVEFVYGKVMRVSLFCNFEVFTLTSG